MLPTTIEETTNGIYVYLAIVEALKQLNQDELFDTAESNMGLKALLWLITRSEILDNHENINQAIRNAVLKCAEEDQNLLLLYERAVLHLHNQQKAAIIYIAEQAAVNTLKRLAEEEAKKKADALEQQAESLSEWDDKLNSRESQLSKKEEELASLEERLKKRVKRRKKHKK